MTTALFCTIVAITNAMGTVAVDTHGARVVSYVPVGGEEVFFASKTGTGGMPLCWPWFAGLGPEGARHRVMRGGDYFYSSAWARSACRSGYHALPSDAGTHHTECSYRFSETATQYMAGATYMGKAYEITFV